VAFDPSAQAFTEAPDTVGGLLKQRFRWSFGTLQCVWKHRAALFNPKTPALGFVALPQIWLFQILLAVAAPLVDLAVVWSLVSGLYGAIAHPVEWSPDDTIRGLLYWAAFILVDLSAGALGMALEKRAPWGDLPYLPVQRFGYRQLMYYVVVKSVLTAARGGPRIDGLVLLSAWLDLRVSSPCYAGNAASDPMFSKESADVAAELYLQGFDPEHPLASPLLAPIAAYPPTLVSVGKGEVLYDDSRLFHEKLTAAGASSRLSEIDGMEHVAVIRSLDLTGAAETFEEVIGFVERILG
jgi:hypothetical protein